MKMEDVVKRINELARKAKTETLTEEELKERDELRQIYVKSVRENLRAQLDNTYIVTPDGTKRKLKSLEKTHIRSFRSVLICHNEAKRLLKQYTRP